MTYNPASLQNLHGVAALLNRAEQLYVKTKEPTEAHLQQVTALLEGEPDAQLLLQMVGLVPEPGYGWVRPGRPRQAPLKPRRRKGTVPCGDYVKYRSGCRCADCKTAWAAHQRAYYHSRKQTQ